MTENLDRVAVGKWVQEDRKVEDVVKEKEEVIVGVAL